MIFTFIAANENFDIKQYLQEIIQDSVSIFHELTTWTDTDRQEFSLLLKELKEPFDKKTETTKDKGDRLENLVAFIIKKSYFFEIYRNVHTGTNEIDEVITLSDVGKQALCTYNISRDLLEIDSDVVLGECKNYESTLGVTYVGKFYSLLVSTDVPFTESWIISCKYCLISKFSFLVFVIYAIPYTKL